MAIRVLDLDLDDPTDEPIVQAGHDALRVLVWRGTRPLRELTLPAAPAMTAAGLREAIAAALGADAGAALPAPEPALDLPYFTIAICTRDRPQDLAQCLTRLRAQRSPPRHELLVVDNAPSSDATVALAREAGARYVREELPGLPFARNRALREARGEVLAYVDDDARPARGWLRAAAICFATRPEVAACTGPVLPAELETQAQLLFENQGGFLQSMQPGVYGPEPPDPQTARHWPCLAVGMFATGNMALRVSVLRELGGFDEALGAGTRSEGGDDHDIFYRLVRSGRRFSYEPSFLVRHRHRRDLPGLRRQMESWGRGTVSFLVKSYRTDPSHRRAIRQAARFLMRYHARRLLENAPFSPSRRVPLQLIFAEIAGSLRGLWS